MNTYVTLACLLAVFGLSQGSAIGYGVPVISHALPAISTANLVKAAPIPVIRTHLAPVVHAPIVHTPIVTAPVVTSVVTAPVLSTGLGLGGLGHGLGYGLGHGLGMGGYGYGYGYGKH